MRYHVLSEICKVVVDVVVVVVGVVSGLMPTRPLPSTHPPVTFQLAVVRRLLNTLNLTPNYNYSIVQYCTLSVQW